MRMTHLKEAFSQASVEGRDGRGARFSRSTCSSAMSSMGDEVEPAAPPLAPDCIERFLRLLDLRRMVSVSDPVSSRLAFIYRQKIQRLFRRENPSIDC